MKDNAGELDKWEPYGKVKPRPANIRNWLMMMDVMDGKSPIYIVITSYSIHYTKLYE